MENDTQLTPFENDEDNGNGFTVEQPRPRAILVVAGIAALMLTILIVALSLSRNPADTTDKALANIVRAGSPEYEGYKNKVQVVVDPVDKMVYDNWLGMWQLQAKATLSNKGDRDLLGVEVVGKMIGHDDSIISQAVRLPIPRAHKDPLKPGESIVIAVKVDAPAKTTEADVKDITIELHGLRFR